MKVSFEATTEILKGIDDRIDEYFYRTRTDYIRCLLVDHIRSGARLAPPSIQSGASGSVDGAKSNPDGAKVAQTVIPPVPPPPRPVRCDYDGCHTPNGDYKTCLDGTKYARQNCPCACHKA